MAALDTLRDHCAELLNRATQGICRGSRLNAELGHAEALARRDDWDSVFALYATDDVRARASA
jgi:hypothetical protein